MTKDDDWKELIEEMKKGSKTPEEIRKIIMFYDITIAQHKALMDFDFKEK
ncbi:hypothetical protein ACFYKT_16800 [Cytobacillus sp. FJAT-53684]|uniref:Uncharacterized protein n=1 Tax=Cytobacillus mangrovibacter TaxID=3299024 RepID=A0ABW6K571_9BACI